MSKPSLLSSNDSPITLTGTPVEESRNILSTGQIALLDLTPKSSGVSNDPRVRFLIDWGDGTTELTSGLLPILRPHQFKHPYQYPGDYWVTLRLMNVDGEVSDVEARATIPIRVKPLPARQRRFIKFAGPVFNTPELSVGTSAVDNVFTGLSLSIATNVSEGVYEVVLSGIPDMILRGAELNFIEDGKLTTFARIINMVGQIATLDGPTVDSYTVGNCRVEVLNQETKRSANQPSARLDDWFFPVGYDEELIRSSLSLLFAIDPGELRFRPNVGFRGREVLFDQADPLSIRLVEGHIRDCLPNDPRVAIDSLEMLSDDTIVKAKIRVRQLASEQAFDVTVPISELTNKR